MVCCKRDLVLLQVSTTHLQQQLTASEVSFRESDRPRGKVDPRTGPARCRGASLSVRREALRQTSILNRSDPLSGISFNGWWRRSAIGWVNSLHSSIFNRFRRVAVLFIFVGQMSSIVGWNGLRCSKSVKPAEGRWSRSRTHHRSLPAAPEVFRPGGGRQAC